MPRTQAEISNAIRAKLRVLDPDISAEPVTPEGKIINTFSEVISQSEIDKYVQGYQFDIDSKIGVDLDKFVALFGFGRQAGRRANGTVTFGRTVPSDEDLEIPAGTQVVKPATTVSPTITFQTVTTVILYRGTLEVDAPIECTITGVVGNVPGGTITSFGATNSSNKISSVINDAATSGGSNSESDDQLRIRFKNTVFRNIAGTQDQYLALAIASRFSNKANVLGPLSRFVEYLQIATNSPTSGLTGEISQIPYSKYTYNFDYYLTDGTFASETFYQPRGVDFTFNNTVPPSITVNNTNNLPVGAVTLLEHSYCSINSRNDPANNIMNYVDIFVSGQDPIQITEAAIFPTSANNFNNTSSSPYYVNNFRRATNLTLPVSGNRFQELLWQPVLDLADEISINDQVYTKNVHYWLVIDSTVYRGSRRARCGIEWSSAIATAIASNTTFSFGYTLDKLPLTLNELMEAHKQITSDVLVHSANNRYFIINLIMMYTPGYSKIAVDQGVQVFLTDFLNRQPFGIVIQVSDIIDAVHSVPGVDNVRLALPSDSVSYGIQEVAPDGVTPIGIPHTTDFSLQDADLPVLQGIVTTQRSQNTWN